jgi:signal transduction histidine kinase
MRVAINNLLTNAIKYSNPGGAVSMSAEETEQTVRVSVRDNGVGISPEDQERIFDKFFRSEDDNVRQRTGHGLGLSLAREIIQLHHGTLSVNSVPGEGSEFIVEFSKEANLLKQAV